ncbi:MAG: 5' nucleotidase, NT5C type [Candidatus Binatia bacterium]
MTLGLDIDGVLADFITPFLKLLEGHTGHGPIDPTSITDPNFMHHPFLTEEAIVACMEAASYDPEFWRALTPLLSSDQWQTLDRISREHDLVFITHRWVRDNYDIHQITCDWLRRHGLRRPVVYFTQEKKSALIRKSGIQLFVDDRHENCEDVATATDAVGLMPHRPYNQAFSHPRVRRIRELDELRDHLK